MKLLIILLILTITIKNCLTINIDNNSNKGINIQVPSSYSMVPYSDKACLDTSLEQGGIGFTFPFLQSNENTPMTVYGFEEQDYCALISNIDGSNQFEIQWFNNTDCSKNGGAPDRKPDAIEQYQVGVCKFSNALGEYYLLTDTDQVKFYQDTIIVQDTVTSSNSKCNDIKEGYYSFFYNSTQSSYIQSWVTYTQTFYCTQNLQPYYSLCSDFGCNDFSLEQDCIKSSFNYKCFGSSSSSSSF